MNDLEQNIKKAVALAQLVFEFGRDCGLVNTNSFFSKNEDSSYLNIYIAEKNWPETWSIGFGLGQSIEVNNYCKTISFNYTMTLDELDEIIEKGIRILDELKSKKDEIENDSKIGRVNELQRLEERLSFLKKQLNVQ